MMNVTVECNYYAGKFDLMIDIISLIESILSSITASGSVNSELIVTTAQIPFITQYIILLCGKPRTM